MFTAKVASPKVRPVISPTVKGTVLIGVVPSPARVMKTMPAVATRMPQTRRSQRPASPQKDAALITTPS